MDDSTRRDFALFRFSIIGPLIACTTGQLNYEEKYRELASLVYIDPNGKNVKFSAATIKKWHLKYRKAEARADSGQSAGGLQALMPHNRMDLGSTRALSEGQQQRIRELKEEFPKISGQGIWDKMVEEGTLKAMDASVDTIQRYLRMINLNGSPGPRKQHLAFEFEHANDCWQCDTMDGPELTIDGKGRQTYFISFLDDHSRKILAAHAFWADNAINMQLVFKEAIRIWGVPHKVMMDNGSPYKNRQLTDICAELGIPSINLLPYSPEGKGKIERYHRDVVTDLLNKTHAERCQSLEELDEKFADFVRKHDNHVNRMTDELPHERFMRDYELLRFYDKKKLDFIFLHREHRRLQNDSTIQFKNIRYEVPLEYITTRGMRTRGDIPFRYDPLNLEELYLVDEEQYQILYTMKPVDLVANSRRKRGSYIDPGTTT